MNEINLTVRKETKRNMGLDILRILSMVMAVVLHYLNNQYNSIKSYHVIVEEGDK